MENKFLKIEGLKFDENVIFCSNHTKFYIFKKSGKIHLPILFSSLLENACSHIFVTLCGIEISSIFDPENAYFSIVCKLEFVGI